MSASVMYPTVLIGLGKFGGEVLERVQQSLDGTSPLLNVLRCEAGGVASGLQPLLEELLRAGRGTNERREPRLDLVLFAAALQGEDSDLLTACEQAARLIAEGYGAIFPPDRPPEQRAVGLHLVVQVPALSHPRASAALARVASVEAWARSRTVFPLLSRIWLVSQQTSAGTLTSAELVMTCSAFAVAAVGSGLRTEDAVGRRLAHPSRGEGPVGFFSVASVEVPESPVREYAAARAAYDGLGTLVARLEQPRVDAALAQGAVAALQPDRWLAPFTDGEPARRCRQEAAALADAPRDVPVDLRVGPFDSEAELRLRYPVLFQASSEVRPATQVGGVRREELFRMLDAAEGEVAATVEQGLHSVFDAWLSPSSGLAQLPHVTHGLEQVVAQLKDMQARDGAVQTREALSSTTASATPEPTEDAALVNAVKHLPSRGRALATSVALSVAVLFAVVAVGLARSAPPAPPTAGPGPAQLVVASAVAPAGTGIDWSEVGPWLAGGLAALVTALGGMFLIGHGARREVRRALEARQQALSKLLSAGGQGALGRQADFQLRARRQRSLRSAILALENAAARLRIARRSVLEGWDRARQSLVKLGITPAAEARSDNLQALVGPGSLLHGLLLPPAVLGRWVASCREVAEERVWADRLLEAAWPAGGLFEGSPCDDSARIDAMCREQVRPLSERSLFEDPEASQAVADTLREFTGRAGAVLAPPCQPVDENGDPTLGLRPGEGFVIAPAVGRDVLEDPLRDVPFRLPVLWSTLKAPRVLFVRTWEGLTVEDVVRGARALSVTSQAAGGRR